MPYDLLTKAGSFTVLAILLLFLLKNYIDSRNKEQDNYERLVDDVRKESKEREDKLMQQLDKYNDSLQSISENMKTIPQMQVDIQFLKERVR